MLKTYLNTTEHDDMSITPYLVLESLPGLLKDLLRVAKTDDERDIHERVPLLIPGDSTYPAFFRLLAAQNGIGYMHESEGSVITDIWRSGAMSYNTALRKAAEHEPLSRNRVAGKEEIVCPRLSLLLTGTFDQFRALVPSVQNGFFSRLTMLVVRGRKGFDKTIFRPLVVPKEGESLSARMLKLYEALCARESPLEFRLTDEQADTLGTYFEREYGALVEALGDNFHPTIVRMGITTMRIACILTVIRLFSTENIPLPLAGSARVLGWRNALNGCSEETGYLEEAGKGLLLCSEEDFATALTIASKLLLHAADAYEQIDGARQAAVPMTKGNYQRDMLLAALPEEFTREVYIQHAQQNGIAQRTSDRWLSQWSEQGIILHPRFGIYQKAC